MASPKCPVHGLTDCSPLLNGCSRLTMALKVAALAEAQRPVPPMTVSRWDDGGDY